MDPLLKRRPPLLKKVGGSFPKVATATAKKKWVDPLLTWRLWLLKKAGGSFANEPTAVATFANLATDIDKKAGGSFANIHTLTKMANTTKISL